MSNTIVVDIPETTQDVSMGQETDESVIQKPQFDPVHPKDLMVIFELYTLPVLSTQETTSRRSLRFQKSLVGGKSDDFST